MTRPFTRIRNGHGRLVPVQDPLFWRSPASAPIKRRRIEEKWGVGTIPTLVYDLKPLQSVGFEETVRLAELFYGESKYVSGTIGYREDRSAGVPMMLLTIKQAKWFHAEIEVLGHRLPLYRVSYRVPGRSSGALMEFKHLQPDPLDGLRPAR